MNKSDYGHKPIRTEATGSKPNPAKELAELKKGIGRIKKRLKELQPSNANTRLLVTAVISDLNNLTKPAARDKGDDML